MLKFDFSFSNNGFVIPGAIALGRHSQGLRADMTYCKYGKDRLKWSTASSGSRKRLGNAREVLPMANNDSTSRLSLGVLGWWAHSRAQPKY